MFINIQHHRYEQKELPRCLCFILVACAPMLADKLGVPGEPGHDWSQTAEQSPRGVRLSVARAANTGAPTERKLL